MSYKDKPQIKLYKYEDSAFVLQAIIDDFQEVSFEHNLYEAGTFTITINYNIPNALKFERGMFCQIGNNKYDFGEIYSIQDAIGQDGKGSQIRTITGRDARYILKRRVIRNMNSNGLWAMTDKGEIVLRNLIKDQCGSSAEAKRQLPIINTIPASSDALGKEYSVSENFSNLYEVCKTIATQSEIGWRIAFNGSLTLEVYEGADLSQIVRFDTSYESLANGEFVDSSDSYSNAIYVGGKGQGDEQDIYEGEDVSSGTPSNLNRFESWDSQSSMTDESEYEAEALSMLTQYGQTLTMSGNGLAKCPYVFQEQYNIGDIITVAFSGKSSQAQILSVTEHWMWGMYDLAFTFGKPQNNLSDQLQLMLRKIQEASRKGSTVSSVRWYDLPTDTYMPKKDVTFNTIGFTGDISTGMTFTLYYNANKTGSKQYNVYVKNLEGTGKLTLTTGVVGSTSLVLEVGTYCSTAYVDEQGNVTLQGATPANVVEEGNYLPVTSDAVAQAISGGGGGTQAIFNIVHPIGEVYVQYPTCSNPNTLYNGNGVSSTWTEITSNYGGAFFRAYANGTSGDFFDYGSTLGTAQASQNKSHNHGGATAGANAYLGNSNASGQPTTTTTFTTTTASGAFGVDDGDQSVPVSGFVKYGTGTFSSGGSIDDLNYKSNGYLSFNHNHTIYQKAHSHTINADGGTEARPANYAIKIWKRTA